MADDKKEKSKKKKNIPIEVKPLSNNGTLKAYFSEPDSKDESK